MRSYNPAPTDPRAGRRLGVALHIYLLSSVAFPALSAKAPPEMPALPLGYPKQHRADMKVLTAWRHKEESREEKSKLYYC